MRLKYKHTIIMLCIVAIVLYVIINLTNIKQTVKIGIFNSNEDAIEQYLKEHLSNIELDVVDLSHLLLNDPFQDTMTIVNSVFTNGEIDMLLCIEPDYLLSQKDKSIFLPIDNNSINSLSSVIKNYIETINYNENIIFLPASIDNTRFLLVNKDILNKFNISLSSNNISMDKLFLIVNQLSNRLGTNEHNIYPISFGSPIDEYFFDDLDKLLLEYKYSQEQLNEYTEKYVKIAQQAKYHSYTRADIGHSYPLDYYFCSGKVALKIATLYELLQIKENTSLGTYNTNNLSYSIFPAPYMNEKEQYNNSKTTLMCVSTNSKNKQECFEVIEFILSKANALRTIEGTNPITTNVASTPIYFDNEIAEKLNFKYGTNEMYYGDNFIPNKFVKNSEYHWEFVNSQRIALMNFIENKTSEEELFYEIKFIMEKWYEKNNNVK